MSLSAPPTHLLRRAALLELAVIVWNVIEAIVAVTAGLIAGSVALVGFGIDSLLETVSATAVGWRFYRELTGRSSQDFEQEEQTAARIAGALLLVLAAYVLIDAGRRLAGFGGQADKSVVGIALTAVSLAVMPLMGWAKLRTARALDSRALRTDAFQTLACVGLSATTLVGLLLNATLGWWWADPLAALLLVPFIIREGIEGCRGE